MAGDAPFFAYITTNAPHGPFIAPPKNTKYFTARGFAARQAGFYGMIENIDENMGRLMGKLKEWDLFKDIIENNLHKKIHIICGQGHDVSKIKEFTDNGTDTKYFKMLDIIMSDSYTNLTLTTIYSV